MNHIVKLSISAPVGNAATLAPLAQKIMDAIHTIACTDGIEMLMDVNLNAASPKPFARNWAKRQQEIAEHQRGRA